MITGGFVYRIRKGQLAAMGVLILTTPAATQLVGAVRVEYDDGSTDKLTFPSNRLSTLGLGTSVVLSDQRAKKDGWVIGVSVFTVGNIPSPGGVYVSVYINDGEEVSSANVIQTLAEGYVSQGRPALGEFETPDFKASYVFQGTVAEDATVGTHVCTLTLTPGGGNELLVEALQIQVGNTATQQNISAYATDGTNNLAFWAIPSVGVTSASSIFMWPNSSATELAGSAQSVFSAWTPIVISGTMQLILQVSTAAVSVTQTFAAICRLKCQTGLPTATLADTVGTPTLTTNTNRVF